MNSSPLHMQFI